MSSEKAAQQSDVLWRGHPWVVPAFIGATVTAMVVAALLAWFELTFGIAFRPLFSFPLLSITLGAVLVLWVVGVLRILARRASNTYVLRGSSLEIHRGIVGKRIFTVSASGFSDLEVIKSIWGRILNTGDIMVETDSRRDLTLRGIKDPLNVAAKIRQVMTTPMVRIAREEPVKIDDGTDARAARRR